MTSQNPTDFEDTFIVTYLSDEVLDTQIALTKKGEYEVDRNISQSLDWLNEPEPKSPNSHPLSEKQKQTLIAMVDCDQNGTIYTVYGRVNRIAMKRLEKRGLVVCTAEGTLVSPELEIGSAYDLTSAGQHTAYNLTEYLPF